MNTELKTEGVQTDAPAKTLTEVKAERDALLAKLEQDKKDALKLDGPTPETTPVKMLTKVVSFDWTKFVMPTDDKYCAIYDTITGALKKVLPSTYAPGLSWLVAKPGPGSRWMAREGGCECVRKLLNKASPDTVLVVHYHAEKHDKKYIGTLESVLPRVEAAEFAWKTYQEADSAVNEYTKTTMSGIPVPVKAEDITSTGKKNTTVAVDVEIDPDTL